MGRDTGDWRFTMFEEIRPGIGVIHWYGLEVVDGEPPEVDLRFERHTYKEDDWFEAKWSPEEGWGTFNVNWQHAERNY